MKPSKRLGAALLTSSLLLALGACGDDDGDDGGGDDTTSVTDGTNTDDTSTDGTDDTATDDTGGGAGADNDAARALRQRMIDDGLTEEQADCTVEALGENLSEDELAQLAEMSAEDLDGEPNELLAASFQAAADCGYNVFNPDSD